GLGVLQALAQCTLLKYFDYLSTVSGGGYIGSWFSAWVNREGSLSNVEIQLKPNRQDHQDADRPSLTDGKVGNFVCPLEPEPIYHLRQYSNYLTPRVGLFSADSWSIAAIYVRNALLNQLVLVTAGIAALVLIRYVIYFFSVRGEGFGIFSLVVTCILFVVCMGTLTAWMATLGRGQGNGKAPSWLSEIVTKTQSGNLLKIAILIPLVLLSAMLAWLAFEPENSVSRIANQPIVKELAVPVHALWTRMQTNEPVTDAAEGSLLRVSPWQWHLTSTVAMGGAFFLFAGFAQVIIHNLRKFNTTTRAADAASGKQICFTLLRATVAGAIAGSVLFGSLSLFSRHVETVYAAATFGPPLVLASFCLISFIWSGALGRRQREETREWLASLAAWIGIFAAVWLASFTVAVYASWGVLVLWEQKGALLASLLASGWLGTVLAGVWSGQSKKTDGSMKHWFLDALALVAPHLAIIGGFIFLSLSTGAIVQSFEINSNSNAPKAFLAQLSANHEGYALPLIFVAAVSIAYVLGWFVDVNLFSLQAMYANRLTRCYLGASRPKSRKAMDRHSGAPSNSQGIPRLADPFTGFDRNDNFDLVRLRMEYQANDPPRAYCHPGPLHLINTALNLTQGDELAWQERKAASFLLSPYYCGSEVTGYRPTTEYAEGITVGQAVAISGAAVDPNMGYHSSPAVTALLTMFNVRLGAWLGNPKRSGQWRNSGPRTGALYLAKELMGRTDFRSKYVHLSDGGHFENLAVYELIRRRCRYIVAIDSGQDGDFQFADLGNLVRKVRTDFGIRIDISTTGIAPDRETGKSSVHCAIGKIRYADIDEGMPDGVLLYLKPSLTGDEPADVRHYSKMHAAFPHESTADQFFDESQFESYRALGYHVASSTFEEVVHSLKGTPRERYVAQLFAGLHRRWPEEPPKLDEKFFELSKGFVEIQQRLEEERLG
ncbi:MAG: hypothetical protein U1D30_27060, partial [Planctomycetota bacterium]